MKQESGRHYKNSINNARPNRGNKGSVKKIVVLLFCFSMLLSVNVFATPSPSNWYKAELIGTNNTHYFYYLTHDELPGSYYLSYTHKYLVSQNINTGAIDKKIHLKTTKNTTVMEEVGDETKMTRKSENTFLSDINPTTIIGEHKVKKLKADTDARRDLKFDGKGMYYIKNEGKTYMLPREYLDKFLPGYEEWFDFDKGIRIVNVYSNGQYYFYILKYGEGGDLDLFQQILPVNRNVFKEK